MNIKDFLKTKTWKRFCLVTGGQTGVDTAAMDLALELNLPLRGWCPKGRLREDGIIDSKYPLQECASEDPAVRTELNIVDSDGTLIITTGNPTDGTVLTVECAKKYQRPYLVMDYKKELTDRAWSDFRAWIVSNNIRILNVAGPRESFETGVVYNKSKEVLKKLLLERAS